MMCTEQWFNITVISCNSQTLGYYREDKHLLLTHPHLAPSSSITISLVSYNLGLMLLLTYLSCFNSLLWKWLRPSLSDVKTGEIMTCSFTLFFSMQEMLGFVWGVFVSGFICCCCCFVCVCGFWFSFVWVLPFFCGGGGVGWVAQGRWGWWLQFELTSQRDSWVGIYPIHILLREQVGIAVETR